MWPADRQVLCTVGPIGEAASTLIRPKPNPGPPCIFSRGTAISPSIPTKGPEIIGNFIRSLARARVMIHGLASSPSAISAIVSGQEKKAAVRQLFQNFHFPAFESPEDSLRPRARRRKTGAQGGGRLPGKDHQGLLDRAPARPGPVGRDRSSTDILAGFADALTELGTLGLQIPFLVAIPGPGGQDFLLSFSHRPPNPLEERGPEIRRILEKHLPDLRPMRLTPVAGIFLHGPHFGDRYGIAQTLVEALEQAHVTLLALSCTISSISLIIRQQELAAAQLVLGNTFRRPRWRRPRHRSRESS